MTPQHTVPTPPPRDPDTSHAFPTDRELAIRRPNEPPRATTSQVSRAPPGPGSGASTLNGLIDNPSPILALCFAALP